MQPGTRVRDKYEVRWQRGVWHGITDRTGETIIGTKDGVIKVPDVRSMEETEAWNQQWFNDIRGMPWEPIP